MYRSVSSILIVHQITFSAWQLTFSDSSCKKSPEPVEDRVWPSAAMKCQSMDVFNCGLLAFFLLSSQAQLRVSTDDSPEKIRRQVSAHLESGMTNELLSYLDSVEMLYGNLLIDASLPSLYGYRGVALHNAQRLNDAEIAFQTGLLYFPNDTRSLLNLGEARTQLFKLDYAIEAFEKAEQLGEEAALSRLLRAKGWSCDWRNFDRITSKVEQRALTCTEAYSTCEGGK